jgi:hypothetical protein
MSNLRAVRMSGPLTKYVEGFCDELTGQGYTRYSASIQLQGHRLGIGPAPRNRAREHRLGDLVKLADVAETESPEERPERRRHHHLVGKHGRGGPTPQ